jgi:hypothetical protein
MKTLGIQLCGQMFHDAILRSQVLILIQPKQLSWQKESALGGDEEIFSKANGY